MFLANLHITIGNCTPPEGCRGNKKRCFFYKNATTDLARIQELHISRLHAIITKHTSLMTGGLSRPNILVKAISQAIGFEVTTHTHARFAGAIGACICAVKRK